VNKKAGVLLWVILVIALIVVAGVLFWVIKGGSEDSQSDLYSDDKSGSDGFNSDSSGVSGADGDDVAGDGNTDISDVNDPVSYIIDGDDLPNDTDVDDLQDEIGVNNTDITDMSDNGTDNETLDGDGAIVAPPVIPD